MAEMCVVLSGVIQTVQMGIFALRAMREIQAVVPQETHYVMGEVGVVHRELHAQLLDL